MDMQQIMDHLGARRWDWVEYMFGGLTVGEIEKRLADQFGWDDTRALAQQIHKHLDGSTLDEATALWLGYEINEGAYAGTHDDRIGRWYIEPLEGSYVRRLGPGFASKEAALRYLTRDHVRA